MIDQALPIIFMFIMGFAMLAYVMLDGYDLGVGMLLPLADDDEKDLMIATIAPFWDANETWIVLGVGVLLIAFPQAHGIVLTSLYLPVTIMLMGLILRGVAFDFRVKAEVSQRSFWDGALFAGSLTASICQGWMLGAYITGLTVNVVNTMFSGLIALTLPALYVLLGAGWLMIKTEGGLFRKAVRWGRAATIPMGIALLLLSVATPIVSEEIAAKWFVMPNVIGLLPIPLSCIVAYLTINWLLYKREALEAGYGWIVFACTLLICVMAGIGLAYSLYPDIVIGRLTIWEAAAAPESLKFVLIGVAVTLPAIIAYTAFVYKIFQGKATKLSYD